MWGSMLERANSLVGTTSYRHSPNSKQQVLGDAANTVFFFCWYLTLRTWCGLSVNLSFELREFSIERADAVFIERAAPRRAW